jgi:uncharacterized membrane protein YeaQ/YmgE (transglycosylase-associated protein family)
MAAGMEIITLIIVGLVAGALASWAMNSYGLGLIGDLALGILGTFLGSWAFRELGWRAPFNGLAGTIAVAFIGAVVLLALLRMLRRVSGAPPRRTAS